MTTIAIGQMAPPFELPDTDGATRALDGGDEAAATAVIFTCNHCPYALAWHDRLLAVARDYADRGVRTLFVNPNDADRYPRDSFDAMRDRVRADGGWPAPYLRDEDQSVARAYGAKTTPDEQSGAGPDIVWLAAGDNPGSNWRRFQTPAFEPGFRNTTYDVRGVGATRTDDPPPWPIAVHARDCAALIEAVCAPPVFLVGLSMGSLIVTELACTRPELVRAALVMGTCVRKTGFIREWEEAEIALRRAGIELPRAFATTHYAMQYLPAEVLGDDEAWALIKPSFEADFGERDGAMLAAQWQACLDYDSRELLPHMRVPVHAVAFSQDVQTPPARVREVAELAADGHFHLLEGLGHGSAFGHRPDAVNDCIRAILEGP
jgi:pimeloyl-ACP methyl ester carboxylesterase